VFPPQAFRGGWRALPTNGGKDQKKKKVDLGSGKSNFKFQLKGPFDFRLVIEKKKKKRKKRKHGECESGVQGPTPHTECIQATLSKLKEKKGVGRRARHTCARERGFPIQAERQTTALVLAH